MQDLGAPPDSPHGSKAPGVELPPAHLARPPEPAAGAGELRGPEGGGAGERGVAPAFDAAPSQPALAGGGGRAEEPSGDAAACRSGAGGLAPAGSGVGGSAACAGGSDAGWEDGSPRALRRALSDPQSPLFCALSAVPAVLPHAMHRLWHGSLHQHAAAPRAAPVTRSPQAGPARAGLRACRACRPSACGATRRT